MANSTEIKEIPEFERWQDVLYLLEQSCQQKHLDFLLSTLLTFDEREALLARMNILHELIKGDRSQRQISQMLGVGVATITRGSTELKKLEQDQKQQLQSLLQAAAVNKSG